MRGNVTMEAYAQRSQRTGSIYCRDDAGWERFRPDSADSGSPTLNGSSHVNCEVASEEGSYGCDRKESPGAPDHPQGQVQLCPGNEFWQRPQKQSEETVRGSRPEPCYAGI